LVAFDISDVFYTAINGLGIKMTLDLTNDFIVGFDFHLSQFLIGLHSNTNNFILKINLIAVLIDRKSFV